jgi:hypothetical protein
MGGRRGEFQGVGIPRVYGYEEMDVYGLVHVTDLNKSTVALDL